MWNENLLKVYVPCTLIVVLSWVSACYKNFISFVCLGFSRKEISKQPINDLTSHQVGFWLNREATSDRVGLGVSRSR